MKFAFTSIFCLHLLIGNVCMMPMASAQDMSGESADMIMSSEIRMSHVHCDGCEDKEKTHQEPMDGMSCAGGYCFLDTSVDPFAAVSSSSPLGLIAFAPTFTLSGMALLSLYSPPPSTAPPDVPISTDTVVFKC